MKYYFKALKNYFNFKGRARRREYWYFTLFHQIILISIFAIPFVLDNYTSSLSWLKLFYIYFFLSLSPSIAVSVRRLHDSGYSGGYIFVQFIPFIGPIWLLVLVLQDSQEADNKYGPCPKEFPKITKEILPEKDSPYISTSTRI